ncbi:uncharacterized protein [Euwallacea fornicatus]|uniref:uncharacterized protein n=1 Tax=Euwallacea fornicatus TaxID=995702 RepID=UPI00338DD60E
MQVLNNCWFALFMFLCVNPNPGESLRCYECTESDVSSCGEPFNKRNVSATDCRNSIYTIDASGMTANFTCMFLKETDVVSNASFYTRRCSARNLNDTCENMIANNLMIFKNIRTDCRQCGTDLCNASNEYFSTICVLSMIVLGLWSIIII